MRLLTRALLAWLPMVVIGIANGIVRETTYGRHLAELRAHQLSSVTAVALFGLYIWGVVRLLRVASRGQAAAVGAFWVALTVVFEFGFGHFVAGHPWSRLVADYDLLAGRIWAVVLSWVGVAPLLFFELRSQRRRD